MNKIMTNKKMSMKIYKEFFIKSYTKNEFIKLVLDKYPYLNPHSLKRRYYDLKKNNPPKLIFLRSNISTKEVIEPIILKKLLIADAKRLNYKITKPFLLSHGFTEYEINWLIKKGEIDLNE